VLYLLGDILEPRFNTIYVVVKHLNLGGKCWIAVKNKIVAMCSYPLWLDNCTVEVRQRTLVMC